MNKLEELEKLKLRQSEIKKLVCQILIDVRPIEKRVSALHYQRYQLKQESLSLEKQKYVLENRVPTIIKPRKTKKTKTTNSTKRPNKLNLKELINAIPKSTLIELLNSGDL